VIIDAVMKLIGRQFARRAEHAPEGCQSHQGSGRNGSGVAGFPLGKCRSCETLVQAAGFRPYQAQKLP